MKELMYVKVMGCNDKEMKRVAKLAQDHDTSIVESVSDSVLLECVKTEAANDKLLAALQREFAGRVEIVRGGTVAIEALDVKTPES